MSLQPSNPWLLSSSMAAGELLICPYTRSVRKDWPLLLRKKLSIRYLITLRVVLLGFHILLPVVLPLLEACQNCLFWYEIQLICNCCHNVLFRVKSCSFQWLLEFGELPEETRGHIRSVRNLLKHSHLGFCPKKSEHVQGTCWNILKMKARSLEVWSLVPHNITQVTKVIPVVFFATCLTVCVPRMSYCGSQRKQSASF